MQGYKRIRVFPERDLRATKLEIAVIDTPVFQRMRNISQLGQSNISFPTAEHSRFSHSLGTLYWASKMVSYMRENYFCDTNKALLEEGDQILRKTVLHGIKAADFPHDGVSWFEQLIRLAALVHDVTHLPCGHTLEDQAGLLERHDEDVDRIRWVFGQLAEEAKVSQHLAGDPHLQQAVVPLLRQCEAFYLVDRILKQETSLVQAQADKKWKYHADLIAPEFLPFLSLAHDVVGNTICADLIDYVHRDTLQCGMAWGLDKILLAYLKVMKRSTGDPYWHLGFSLASKKFRHDVVTSVLGLLRARYDLAEKVYYHHAKCAADALLEKIIRAGNLTLDWKTLIDEQIGSEGFIQFLRHELKADPAAAALLADLARRYLPKAVYRLTLSADWSPKTRTAIEKCRRPEGRTAMEKEIAEICGLKPQHIIIGCLPKKMQLKQAKAMVEWSDGDVLTLDELPREKGYLKEVTELTNRYEQLWSLTVYFTGSNDSHAALIERRCENQFGRRNDGLLADYIRRKYRGAFTLQGSVDKISSAAEKHAMISAGVATGGGDPQKEPFTDEVAQEAFLQVLRQNKDVSPDADRSQIRRSRGNSDVQPMLRPTASEPATDT